MARGVRAWQQAAEQTLNLRLGVMHRLARLAVARLAIATARWAPSCRSIVASRRTSCATTAEQQLDGRQTLNERPLQPIHAGPAESTWLRCFHQGGTMRRDGWLVRMHRPAVTGADVLAQLQREGVDLAHLQPRVYDTVLGGWAPLEEATTFERPADAGHSRIDLQLCRREEPAPSPGCTPSAGYFLMGAYGVKNSENVGTLWRSSRQFGASGLFTIGRRSERQRTDTNGASASVPLSAYNDWNSFAAAAPRGAMLVAVEFGGTPLEQFEHPARACYILGSEDTGLPQSVVRACHRHLTIPSVPHLPSFNLGVAGSLVMYDRVAKALRQRESVS